MLRHDFLWICKVDLYGIKKHCGHMSYKQKSICLIHTQLVAVRTVSNWVTRQYFYEIKFDKPYTVKEELPKREGEKAKRLILEFDLKKGEKITDKNSHFFC